MLKKSLFLLEMIILLFAVITSCTTPQSKSSSGDSSGAAAGGDATTTYTVTYNGNGATGTAPVDSANYEAGTTVTVKGSIGTLAYNYNGIFNYIFMGWNTTGSGTTYTSFTMPASNVTLYAVWSPIGAVCKDNGYIFYQATGLIWKFLEAYPNDLSSTYPWGIVIPLSKVLGTSTGIGYGLNNTTILKSLSAITNAASECYNIITPINTWFLPSKDELNQMYQNLKTSGIGNFSNAKYWSSSEYDVNDQLFGEILSGAYLQDFTNGAQTTDSNESDVYLVRPVREIQ
jgi:uncharacterized repeat protein (TIGR02543 family)